jgi:hypothetical protein
MAEHSVAPKPLDRDPCYQATRLRGLAGLVRASGGDLQDVSDVCDVMFYLASALDEIADKLDGGA